MSIVRSRILFRHYTAWEQVAAGVRCESGMWRLRQSGAFEECVPKWKFWNEENEGRQVWEWEVLVGMVEIGDSGLARTDYVFRCHIGLDNNILTFAAGGAA